jgi:RNA polymerase sigma factor for flagellar operon FliA
MTGERNPALSSEREALIRENLHLPRVTALLLIKGLANVELEDLVGAGNLGLCKAAREFDFARNVTFKTYAIALIRAAILDMLRQDSEVPRALREKVRADRRKSDTGGQNDTVVDMKVSLQELTSDQATADRQAYIADPSPSPEEMAILSVRKAALAAAVDRLPEDERFAILSYYSGGLTHKQIGALRGLSQSRAYQLWQQGIQRLRSYLQADSELFV